jgi:hypothetical protein
MTPRILGLEAQRLLRLLVTHQRLVRAQSLVELNRGEVFSHQISTGAIHNAVIRRDDEDFRPGDVGLQSLAYTLRRIPVVNITPKIPDAQGGISPEPGTVLIDMGIDDV